MIFESIQNKLRAQLNPTHLELINESHTHHRGGAETHFRLVVVSPVFQGLSRVERQRRVYGLLDEERQQGLHALAMWTYTPEEWVKIEAERDLSSPDCHSAKKI